MRRTSATAAGHSTTTLPTRVTTTAGETRRAFRANYAGITNIVIKEGRFITENDDQQRANVMVIGVNAADALFPGQNHQIAGTKVRMGGYNFEIVGVLEKRKAGFFGENEEDNAVFIPFRTAQKVAPAKGYLLLVIKARSGQTD